MTVKELIERLKKYPENDEVEIYPFDFDDIGVGTLSLYDVYKDGEKVTIETA